MKWWGYLHVNGTVHPRRYFDDRDLEEANESSFVSWVSPAFKATDRLDAINKLNTAVRGRNLDDLT